jgi:hypothetical protein
VVFFSATGVLRRAGGTFALVWRLMFCLPSTGRPESVTRPASVASDAEDQGLTIRG